MSLPFPLSGSTLITGPSNVGKTRLTYRALRSWVEANGTDGVVVFEFAPALFRDGEILGGRLDQFGPIPEDAWLGVVDAHAPRAEGESVEAAVRLARQNAERADRVIRAAPSAPTAVFVNDATIPFQSEAGEVGLLTGYADRAGCAVLNAFASEELGTDDPVSRRERAVLASLRAWADRTVALPAEA